jgi:hypothetical protein
MDSHPDPVVVGPDWVTFITPTRIRVINRAYSLVVFLGALLIPAACAGVVFILATQCGAPEFVAWLPAAVTYILFFVKGCQVAAAPTRFRIALGPESVSIGHGWLRRTYSYDEVEQISLPERSDEGHGIGLEGGERGAFVYLSPADEAQCAALLRAKCKNAIFVDHSGDEHLPTCPDRPLMSIGALYRRNRSLALGTIIPIVFAASICIFMSIALVRTLLGFVKPGATDLLDIGVRFLVSLVAVIWLIRFGSQRTKKALLIQKKMKEYIETNAEA